MGNFRGRSTWLVGLACLIALVVAAPASANTTSKPYGLTVSALNPTYETAPLVAGGQVVAFQATMTNLTGTQQLGSANLYPPAYQFDSNLASGKLFAIQSTPAPSGSVIVSPGSPQVQLQSPCAAGSTVPCVLPQSSCTFGSLSAPCLSLRNLSLQPGGSVTVTVSLRTPTCQQGSYAWNAEAKQSNNFSGTPGNDLSPPVMPTDALDGACSLAFVSGNQPADSQANQPIGITAFTPAPPGPQVEALDGGGNVVSGFTAPISVAPNKSVFTSDSTTSVTASSGIATFDNLKLATAGFNYAINASSGTLTGATSSKFAIQTQAITCNNPGASCSTPSDGNGAGTIQVTANAGPTGTLVESAFSNGQLQLSGGECTSYLNSQWAADGNSYEYAYLPASASTNRDEVAMITIVPPASLVGVTVNKVLKNQQICFGVAAPAPTGTPTSPPDFTTDAGTLAPFVSSGLPDGSGGYIGLLPTCTGSTTGPCHNRQLDTTITSSSPGYITSPTGYDIVLAADIPAAWAGDPWSR